MTFIVRTLKKSMKTLKFLANNIYVKFGLFPLLVFFVIFCLLTFPAITQFSSHLYGDQTDALIHVWNLWHVDKSVSNLQSPWHTNDLQFPSGTTLLAHTLNLTNSLLGILLMQFLSITQTYNLLVIFAFTSSGLTAFILAYYFSRSYWPSIVGGFIFAFSGYQMLHIGSHLNLNSIQWIPLFLLFWHIMLQSPRLRWALLAALFLIITFYTELYYFLYCVLAAVIVTVVFVLKKRSPAFLLNKDYLQSFGLFLWSVLIFTGPFILNFMRQGKADPFWGSHEPLSYSADLFGPFMPGFLKSWYGRGLVTGEGVGETCIGLTVLGLLAYTAIRRKKFGDKFPLSWFVIFFTFLVFSFGPFLQIGNKAVGLTLPYKYLEQIIPGMDVSGVPVRMIVMVTLAAAVIVSMALANIVEASGGRFFILLALSVFILVEYWPAQQFRPSLLEIDEYAQVLAALPGNEAVFDDRSVYLTLLYQTVHERPIYYGMVSRLPTSVYKQNLLLEQAFVEGNLDILCKNGFRYVAVDRNFMIPGAELIYSGKKSVLFDLDSYSDFCDSRF